jgi:hypothetical protein
MKNPLNTWFVSQKWSKRFFASHMFGWITAFVQTFWIVIEIKAALKKILKALE